MKKARFAILLTMTCGPLMSGARAATVFYVSLKGKDQWSGRLADPNAAATDGPFATLERARDAVREVKRAGLTTPVDVVVRGGVYDLPQTFVLTPEDSGRPDCPVTWRGQEGERPMIRGARRVTGWQPWRDGIWRADLKAQGMGGVTFHQLFFRGAGAKPTDFSQRLILARYPNFDPEHPITGGNVYMPGSVGTVQERCHEVYYTEGALPLDQWQDMSQAEVVSTYNRGWHFAITPILSVDRAAHILNVQPVRGEFIKLNRFFIQNVLDALDAPGEWYLDYRESVLYLYPPAGESLDKSEVLVPLLDNLIELKGALPYPFDYLNMAYKGKFEDCPLPPDAPAPNPISYVRLQGFDFEVAEQDAVRIRGARRCEVLSCRATNLGNIGVNIGAATSAFPEEGNPRRVPATGHLGGATGAGLTLLLNDPGVECRVEGCDLWSLGNEGIMLVGTNNVAENNHVYDIGLYVKDEACINLLGDGNIARRNTVHDCPHTGIFLKGVNNVVEMNDVHHTVLESCDMGGIRMVQRNVNLVGNVIRNNRVFDSVGYGCFFASTRNNALQPDSITHFESPYDAYGIYLDDITCGTTIEDNIVARASRCGINIHGGSGNTVVNNVFVDNGMAAIEFMPFPNRQSPGVFHMGPGINQTSRNILASQPPCIPAPYHFMNMTQPKENPVIENNLIWCAGAEMIAAVGGVRGAIQGTRGLAAWLAQGIDHGSIVGDPLFVDPAHDDYRLKPDSPAYKLGFQDIPMDQIGCYASPARASWPIAPNYDRVREKPVLYQELGWKPGAEPRQGQSPASRPRQ